MRKIKEGETMKLHTLHTLRMVTTDRYLAEKEARFSSGPVDV